MDQAIWAQTEARFEALRQENQREEAHRQAEIAQKHPDLYRLTQERHDMILRSVRGAFTTGTPQDPEAVMREYNRKISDLLQSRGYPADYLTPVYHCPVCQDQGYVYDHAVRKPCACFLKAYDAALAQAGEDGRAPETFDAFDESRFPDAPLPGSDVTQREYMGVVRARCRQFADGVPVGPVKTLLLHGGSGLGKTFLLRCVGSAVRDRGVETLSVTAYDLLADLKAAYFSRDGEPPAIYFDVPLLLIDDLGMEPLMQNITVEQIYNLLNARLNRGMYTALTTNLSREELKARYTERVASRLLDTRSGMAIPFLGKDIRLVREKE